MRATSRRRYPCPSVPSPPGKYEEESKRARGNINRANKRQAPENKGSRTQKRKLGRASHNAPKPARARGLCIGLNSHWGGFIDTKIGTSDPLYPFGHAKHQ